jgi:hypothetical protein
MNSPIIPAGKDWSAESAQLKAAGYNFAAPMKAKLEVRQVADRMERGSAIDMSNRQAVSDMNRRRLAGGRGATIRTASDLSMALPKIRQPGASLLDKGIPFNIHDPKELIQLRQMCRFWYSTHDLVPLLVDIYSKFPVTGLEFQSKDPLIEKFYTEMFLDDLNYEEFLPDSIGREYFVAGEVTTLAHFNEELGIWSSEEVLNPDMVAVSKSLFVDQERVQLLVKDMVEGLRSGPHGRPDNEERPSERLERNFEYQQLVKYYPEIIQAALRDDGLDISDALVSRLVNKASPWDMRGTPPLLRSARTLMMEESLNAAQDAVADRLYSPMVLATMGLEDMGNGTGPWIPGIAELDNLRDDMQSALAADFKLLVHNIGVKVESVFGRESVPNFDADYDRIDAKLMQAWGIGQALIMGGTGAGGTYASSAINREVCEQLMMGFQKKVVRHMRKRMEVIAEAQEHYDYELKGGLRVPLYREIVEEDPDSGERRIVRVPKLLIPDVKFATLNLRDESTERAFIQQLKASGVPVSDKALAINIEVDFEQELEREAQETVDKAIAKSQAWKKVQDLCDLEGLPYPEELVAHLTATLTLRQQLAQTTQLEDQAKMMDAQAQQASPAGQTGAMPGVPPQSVDPETGQPVDPSMGGGDPSQMGGDPSLMGDPTQMDAGAEPPMSSGPSGPAMGEDPAMGGGGGEPPRNRSRPPESDEMRGGAPKSASQRWAARIHNQGRDDDQHRPPTKFELGPSSVGHARHATQEDIRAAIQRREMTAKHSTAPLVSQLVRDPNFYRMLNMGGHQNQIQSDWPEIRAGGAEESDRLLRDMLERYEDSTGVQPIWD